MMKDNKDEEIKKIPWKMGLTSILGVGTILMGLLPIILQQTVILKNAITVIAAICLYLTCFTFLKKNKSKIKANYILINIVIFIFYTLFTAILIKINVNSYESLAEGSLKIQFNESVLSYQDENGIKNVTRDITDELKIQRASFESLDEDFETSEYKVDGDSIFFGGVTSGNCSLEIKANGYDMISTQIKLKKSDLIDGEWNKTYTISAEEDYKKFSVQLLDKNNNPLNDSVCDIKTNLGSSAIESAVTDEDGKLPYTFSARDNCELIISTKSNGKTYEIKRLAKDLDNDAVFVFNELLGSKSQEEQKKLEEEQEKKAAEQILKDEQEKIANQAQTALEMEMNNNPLVLLKNVERINTNVQSEGEDITHFNGNLSEDKREVVYEFSLDQSVPLWLEFVHPNLTEEKEGWGISVQGQDGVKYIEYTSLWNKENTISPVIGLKPGTYQVTINSKNFSNAEFELFIKKGSGTNFESERNDEILESNKFSEVKDNTVTTVMGNLANYDDVDYYAFELTGSEVMALKFEHDNLTEDKMGWKIKLMNSNSEFITEFESAWNKQESFSSNVGLASGTYYVEVSHNNNFNDSVYALSLVAHNSIYWEQEFNNTIQGANEIIETYYTNGSLGSQDDVDYYKFACKESGFYHLGFEHENLAEDRNGWSVDILDDNSESMLKEIMQSKLNVISSSANAYLEADKTYFVKIERSDGYSNIDYKFKIYR